MEILDGNTVKVLMDGLVYMVRYIGVQAPLDDRHAFNAYLANSNLVFRKDVTLIADQVDRDPSGRLLRSVLVGDTFVNIQLLQDGQDMAGNDLSGYFCAEEFAAAESFAVQAARGMWATATPFPIP